MEIFLSYILNPIHPFIKTAIIRIFNIFIMVLFIYRLKLDKYFFTKKIFSSGIKKGVIFTLFTGFVFIFLWFVLKFFFHINIMHFFLYKLPDNQTIIMLVIAGGIISPIAEELFFRGLFYSYLRQNFNFIISILMSSFIFAMLHFANGTIPLLQFTGGMLFALAYEYTKNIYVPITIHIAGNIFIFAVPLAKKLELFNFLFG